MELVARRRTEVVRVVRRRDALGSELALERPLAIGEARIADDARTVRAAADRTIVVRRTGGHVPVK